jgi:hypothetical protein
LLPFVSWLIVFVIFANFFSYLYISLLFSKVFPLLVISKSDIPKSKPIASLVSRNSSCSHSTFRLTKYLPLGTWLIVADNIFPMNSLCILHLIHFNLGSLILLLSKSNSILLFVKLVL